MSQMNPKNSTILHSQFNYYTLPVTPLRICLKRKYNSWTKKEVKAAKTKILLIIKVEFLSWFNYKCTKIVYQTQVVR